MSRGWDVGCGRSTFREMDCSNRKGTLTRRIIAAGGAVGLASSGSATRRLCFGGLAEIASYAGLTS